MTIPFRRDQSDADRLNDLLDAMRSGTRAPDDSADAATDLARTARQFRGLADRAASIDPASATTFDTIWEDMMSAHTIAPPLPADTGPATPITPETHRVPTVPGMPEQSRWQSLLSAAIVMIVLIGLVAAAWNLRGSDSGITDPDDSARLAATALQAGTPEASPESQPAWMDYTLQGAERCAPIRTMQETDALINEDRDWPERAYLPFGDAPESELDDIVEAARLSISCDNRTDRNYWEVSSQFAPPYQEMADRQHALSQELSAAFPIQDPSAFVFLSHEEPGFGIGRSASPDFIMTPAYAPQHAVTLADGRVAIPTSFVIWADGPNAPINPDGSIAINDFFRSGLLVLAQEDGEWRVDEQLQFCVGNCDTFWSTNAREALFLDPIPPPGQSTPSPATPITLPDIESETLTWISPEECVVEDESSPPGEVEASTLMTDPTYIPIAEAHPNDAIAAAQAARVDDACFVANSGNTLDEYSFVASMEESFDDRASRQQKAGQMVSAEFPVDDTSQFFVFTDEQPGETGNANLVFQPQHAVELADGRILIPGTWLIWTGDPSFIQEAPEDFITQAVVMEQIDGRWVLSENLPVCIGDCEGMWPEISPFVSEYSPIRIIETLKIASPEASVPSDWTAWVQPEECTVEPMMREEYAEVMREEPDISGRSYEIVGPADPETAEAVASAARAHEACGLFGTYQQERALQTDGYIFFRQFSANQTISYGEWLAMNRKHGMLLSETMPILEPSDRLVITSEDPPDELPPLLLPPDIPIGDLNAMVFYTTTYLPDNAMLLADGRIAIPVTTLAWSGNAADPEYERAVRGFFDRFLENDRLLILSDKSGTWKVDEDLRFCQSDDCDQFWNPTLATPDATPVATPED